jgi:AcrR family transcriptional regulator
VPGNITTADTEQSGPKRRRLGTEERRAQIVAAAREVFIEQGVQGARARLVAERAGITEAYLYRKFHSLDELFQLAIDDPLDELTTRLHREMRELGARDDVSQAEVLLRCHELLLGCMVEIAPLIGAALCANRGPDKTFYADYLLPKLRSAVELVIPDITGRSVEAFEVDVLVEAMIGIHLTIALDHLLEGESIDVPVVAQQVTEMFAPGVGRRRRAAPQTAD